MRIALVPGTLCTEKLWGRALPEALKDLGHDVGLWRYDNNNCLIVAGKELAAWRPDVVVGHSLGGYVGAEAVRENSSIKGLALVGSQLRNDSEQTRNKRQQLVRLAESKGVAAVLSLQKNILLAAHNQHLFPNLQQMALEVGVSGFVNQQHAAMQRRDSTDVFRSSHPSLLLCCGNRDAVIPSLISRSIHQNVPNSSLRIFPDTGHMLPLESPDEFNKVILDWISTL